MTKSIFSLLVILAFSFSLRAVWAQEKLGKVDFPVSCGPEAQAQFNRAVAMLHSFWFPQAPKAFAAVARPTPTAPWLTGASRSASAPIRWWALPTRRRLKRGLASVERAKAIGAKTQRERDYIAAIEFFYKDSDKLDHRTRVLAYEKAMERLYRAYSEDPEAAVFYALALNEAIDLRGQDLRAPIKAARILEKVYAKQPEHPGVLHYLIHSYDFPPLAARGLDTASAMPRSPLRRRMPCTCRRISSRCSGCGRSRSNRTAKRSAWRKIMFMRWTSWSTLTCSGRRTAKQAPARGERRALQNPSADSRADTDRRRADGAHCLCRDSGALRHRARGLG